jgi:hypothetical protein
MILRYDTDFTFDSFFDYLFEWLFGFSYDVETPSQGE